MELTTPLKDVLNEYVLVNEEIKSLQDRLKTLKSVLLEAHEMKDGVAGKALIVESGIESKVTYRNSSSLDLELVKARHGIDLSEACAPECYTHKRTPVLKVKTLLND